MCKGQGAPLKNLAIELNTPPPSSATCERMFNSLGLILRLQEHACEISILKRAY